MPKHALDSQHTSVSASITLAVLHAASRLGVDRAQLMSACKLSDPDARVPFATQEQLWQQFSRIEHAEALFARLPSEGLIARVVALLGEQLARHLHQSERTLQRRLADEGCNYQQLLNDTRQQLAEQHLSTGDLPAAEIALLLGYSQPSVFFHAFRQWAGLAPGEYRARQKLQ